MRRSVVGSFVIAAFVASCGGGKPAAPAGTPKETSAGSAVSAMAKMGNLATDPFAQMSFTFEGNPPAAEIKEKVDKVLAMYGVEVNDQNRSQAGRTLVALRKEHGHSEMAILDKMLSSPAAGEKFDDAAARISAEMNR